MKGRIKMIVNLSPLDRLQRKSPESFNKALKKGAIQLLTWMNNSSVKESRKPPIAKGFLRGSSSAFVGNKLVSVFPGSTKGSTPNKSYNGKATTITVGWNTSYAAKMHEWNGGWGKFTEQDGDSGNKWIEKHLSADKKDLMAMIKKEFQKEAKL